MTEDQILELFLKSNIGQKTIKKINTLKAQNDQYQKEVIFLSNRVKELEEKLNSADIQYQTKSDENAVRELMNDCISAYKGRKPNKYLFSIADENGKEIRIYKNQVKEMIEGLGTTEK